MSEKHAEKRTGWEALYDFLDEIFATMIPGAFFTSFFFALYFIAAPDFLVLRINEFSENIGLLSVAVVGAIAYCFGAIFHRKEIKRLDSLSARYIYRNRSHDSGHSFAFANALTNHYVKHVFSLLRLILLSIPSETLIPKNEESSRLARTYFERMKDARGPFTVTVGDSCLMSKTRADIEKELIDKTEEWLKRLSSNTYLKFESDSDEAFFHDLHNLLQYPPAAWGMICKKDRQLTLYNLGHWFLRHRNINYNTLLILSRRMAPLVKKYEEATGGPQLCRLYAYITSDLKGNIDWPYTHMYAYCHDRKLDYACKVNWGDGAIEKKSPFDRVGLTTDQSFSDEIRVTAPQPDVMTS